MAAVARHKVIVVGAGMGGLTTAAALARAGVEPLVLERTPFPGGRCYARTINGHSFDIGAVYLGSRVPEILTQEFGIECPARPFRIGVRMDRQFVSFPFDARAIRDLWCCGVPGLALMSFLGQIPRLYRPATFSREPSLGGLLDRLTGNPILRQLGYIAFGVSGVNPYRLPSHFLGRGAAANGTEAGNPVSLATGNRQAADLLVAYVRAHGGDILFQEGVRRIIADDHGRMKILTNRSEYLAECVVSNAGVKATVLELTDSALWGEDLSHEARTRATTLPVVNVFLTMSSGRLLPEGHGVFFQSYDAIREFEALDSGQFPERSMFILQVPAILRGHRTQPQCATLQFYHPRGRVSAEVIQRQARRIITDGLDDLFPGLSQRIEGYTVYAPDDYEREFGLTPVVCGIAPDREHRRFSIRSPLPNLFLVGDSVGPDRPSVPQAMESGLLCARAVLTESGRGRADRDRLDPGGMN
jgi:phytoene dehydrogenase-like protein